MSSHRGPFLRTDKTDDFVASNGKKKTSSTKSSVAINKSKVSVNKKEGEEDKVFIQRIRQKAKELRELSSSTSRSYTQGLDSVSLETEGTGLSTLTSSSGGRRSSNSGSGSNIRSSNMSPAQFTIYENELLLQSRVAQPSYISRPIDVDSMQEYDDDDEEEKGLKPQRNDLMDDSHSRTTESTYSSRPIDVDSVQEYDPEEYPETRLLEERFEKILNFNNGYYEGESLLEYSSDDDSVDFDTGLAIADSSTIPVGTGGKVRNVASLKHHQQTIPATTPARYTVSVDLVGPLHLDTSHCVSPEPKGEEYVEELSFHDWEFPILDEREIDRELVGYMEGFEPIVEDLSPPRARLGRKHSDATSTRSSSNTRVTFEI